MTEEQKQQIINYLQKMDNIQAFAGNAPDMFFIESCNSPLPVNRVAGKLERRGARVQAAGKNRKMIIFDKEIK